MSKRFYPILVGLLTVLGISPALSQIAASNTVQNLNLATGFNSFVATGTVLSPGAATQPVNLHGTAQINYVTLQTIKLEPGFSVHALIGSGQFHAFSAEEINNSSLNPPSVPYCTGSVIPFTLSIPGAQSGVSYNWYKNDVLIANFSGSSYTETVPPLTPTTYKVESFNNNNRAYTYSLAQTNPTSLTDISTPVGPSCYNEAGEGVLIAAAIGGSGIYTYTLDGNSSSSGSSGGSGSSNGTGSSSNSSSFNGLTVGQHALVITDNTGCSLTDNITIPPVNLGGH